MERCECVSTTLLGKHQTIEDKNGVAGGRKGFDFAEAEWTGTHGEQQKATDEVRRRQ